MERSAQKVVPHFRLLVSEHSCRYYNILSDRVLFLTEISVVLSILLPKFIDWVLIMKWSNDSLWLMSYGKYFDHEMVEWYHMENILTMRWSNDFIRHLPYNETWYGLCHQPAGDSGHDWTACLTLVWRLKWTNQYNYIGENKKSDSCLATHEKTDGKPVV